MILRMALSEYGTFQAVYNNMVKLGDQYIAQDVKVVTNGVPVMNFHVQQIENMASVNDADFIPSPEAKKQGEPTDLAISTGVSEQHLLRRVQPQYPPVARNLRVQGDVILKVMIDKDGHVNNIEPVGGPTMLKQAAIDAVSQWQYKPYVMNHVPTEVHTSITVRFSLKN
jgi:TonB family protein